VCGQMYEVRDKFYCDCKGECVVSWGECDNDSVIIIVHYISTQGLIYGEKSEGTKFPWVHECKSDTPQLSMVLNCSI